ncbi:Rap1 GTPase-activating protein 2 [Takifugu flavidus]|uniref:Rap1 GTPase-activating protein 2 n=1 Tax=Takifugu flavidus TaxID=433684 RepID=A0A5C6P6G6_9TELE|nr:Rap1 GTPase-activating protein 2 [Takifugu flavidus]
MESEKEGREGGRERGREEREGDKRRERTDRGRERDRVEEGRERGEGGSDAVLGAKCSSVTESDATMPHDHCIMFSSICPTVSAETIILREGDGERERGEGGRERERERGKRGRQEERENRQRQRERQSGRGEGKRGGREGGREGGDAVLGAKYSSVTESDATMPHDHCKQELLAISNVPIADCPPSPPRTAPPTMKSANFFDTMERMEQVPEAAEMRTVPQRQKARLSSYLSSYPSPSIPL